MISAIRGQKESIARATAAKGSMRPEPNTVNRRRKALVMLCKRVLWRFNLPLTSSKGEKKKDARQLW